MSEEFLQDLFNWIRRTFIPPESFRAHGLPQWGMYLLYFAAFFAFTSGVWIWLFLPTVLVAGIPVAGLVGMGCAVSGLRVLGSDADTRVLGRLESFAEDFFMPYVVCPKCDVEALHHLSVPDAPAILMAIDRYRDQLRAFTKDAERWPALYRSMVPPEPGPLAAIGFEFLGTPDVIRTCRDCGHQWGQRAGGLIMPTEAIAEADAPTLRAPKTNFKDK